MSPSRRDLIKLGIGVSASLLARDRSLFAQQAPALIRKKIPSSGEEIPVIGLGSSGTFNLTSQHPEYADALEVLRQFKARGGKVIDTAPTYQRSEIFLGEALATLKITNDIFIATKVNVGPAGKAAAIAQMEGSSRAYGRRSVDLMEVWNLGDSIRNLSAAYLDSHMDAVNEWKAMGRTRYIGITTSRDPQYGDLEAAMKKYKLDFVQLDYSIEDRIPDQRLLPLARERGIAVIANRPFTAGNAFGRVRGKPLPAYAAEFDCTSWAQFMLKFVVSHPGVTCTIPATGDPKHLEDNFGACFGRLPDEATRRRMIQTFDAL